MFCLDNKRWATITEEKEGKSSYYINKMSFMPRMFRSPTCHKEREEFKPVLPKEFLR